MARRASAIKRERNADNDNVLLVVDSGNSLAGQWTSLKSEGKVIVDAMNAMGYDAMAIGRMDLAIGLEAVRARAQEAEFAMLSCNLVLAEDNQLLFDPYVILDKGGIKVGIVGVSEPEALQAPGMTGVGSMLEPIEAVRAYVDELRPQVDLLVVLSRLSLAGDHELAHSVPGIDVIIGGVDRKLMREPETEGNTLLAQMGSRGEWMGRLKASYDAAGQPSDVTLEMLTLDDNYADDEEMIELVQPYKDQYPTPTPRPTWTPDPRTPTADMTKTVQAFQTRAMEIRTQTAAAPEATAATSSQ